MTTFRRVTVDCCCCGKDCAAGEFEMVEFQGEEDEPAWGPSQPMCWDCLGDSDVMSVLVEDN